MSAVSFTDATNALLSRAASFCSQRGTRLTELRRLVLGLVLDSDRPAGAYDLLDQLRARHKGAAPPTVYRALDFLLEQGLIHKVERLSAFVGCVHATHENEHDRHHVAQFLICTRCRRVVELEDKRIDRALLGAARDIGFRLAASTIEAEGICAACTIVVGSEVHRPETARA